MQTDHDHVNQFDANERCNYTAHSPNQQIATQQRVGADGTILHTFERDRNQQRNNNRIENHRRQNRRSGRVQIHDVEWLEPRQRRGEQARE